jgi:glycerol-3-phosphate acyltransferase PlsY
MLVFEETVKSMNVFAMAVSIMILVTHQKNIERLLRGKESKVNFRGRAMAEEQGGGSL